MRHQFDKTANTNALEEVVKALDVFLQIENTCGEILNTGKGDISLIISKRQKAVENLVKAINRLETEAPRFRGTPEWEEICKRLTEIPDLVNQTEKAALDRGKEIINRLKQIDIYKKLLKSYPKKKVRSIDPKFIDRMG